MLGGPIESRPDLWNHWVDAVRQPEVAAELQGIYDAIGEEIAAHGPTCWISGKCCKFDSYGHDLLATGLETAWLLEQLRVEGRAWPEDAQGLPTTDGCPFQIDGRCSVHPVRPMGCRIYYCDPANQDWQSPLYEKMIARLKQLHEDQQIEYRLIEWRRALRAALLAMAE